MAMSALYTALETMGGPMAGGDPFADPSEPQTMPPAPDMSGLNALKLVDLDMTITDKSLVTFLMGLGATRCSAARATSRRSAPTWSTRSPR